jgi:SAM-dependent methyltransferase
MGERTKYEEIWKFNEYRATSPAEEVLPLVLHAFGEPGTLIDFGCGTGRAMKRMQEKGFDVLGVDIAYNSLDESLRGVLPMVVANFSQIPLGMLHAHYGLCVDVLEHLPPDELPGAMALFASCVDTMIVQVANFEEGHGRALIGKPLHLSFFEARDWQTMLGRHFTYAERIDLGDDSGLPRYAFKCYR